MNEQNTYLYHTDAINLSFQNIQNDIQKQKSSRTEKTRWNKLNETLMTIFERDEPIHLLKHCTGSGKSTNAILWCKNLVLNSPDIDGFVVLSTEYENGTYDIKKTMDNYGEPIDYILFEGKNRLCLCKNVEINETHITLEDLMKNGISINPYCDEECTRCKECEYKYNCNMLLSDDDTNKITNWICVSHQLNSFLPFFLDKNKNIILVLDEEFSDSIKIHEKHKFKTLKDNKHFLEYALQLYIENNKRINEDYVMFIEHLIKFLDHLINALLYEVDTFDLDYDQIETLLFGIALDEDKFYYFSDKLNKTAYYLIRNNSLPPFKFIISQVCNFIINYLYEFEHNSYDHMKEWIRMAFYKKVDKFYISFLYYDKVSLVKVFEHNAIAKVIITDATGNEFLYKNICTNVSICTHDENWIYDNSEIHQMRKAFKKKGRNFAQYPKSSIANYRGTYVKLLNGIRKVVHKHKKGKILVVSRNIEPEEFTFGNPISLKDAVESISNRIKFEDYPLKATNKYKNYSICIILGTPDLPNIVVLRQSILLGITKETYRYLYSLNNVLQAMGRIMRGNDKKYFYLFTGMEISFKITHSYNSFSDFFQKCDVSIDKTQSKIEQTITELKKFKKGFTFNDYVKKFNVKEWKAREQIKYLVEHYNLKSTFNKNIEIRGEHRKKIYHF